MMLQWILLICCACLITLEARHFEQAVHGHLVSQHVKRENNSRHHFHSKRDEDSKEASDDDSEESSESSKEENKNVCQTEACHQTALFIKRCMDDSVDPCVDFEQYACGSWAENHKIPPHESSWSTMDFVENVVNNLLSEILSKDIAHEDILPVKLSKKWYKSCIDTDELNRKGLRPLVNVLARIGGWPMAMEPNEWDEEAFSWQRVDKYYARLTGSITFVQTKVIPDYIEEMFRGNKKTTLTIQIEKMELPMMEHNSEAGFKRTDFSAGEDYKRLIEETAIEIIKERGVDVPREAITKDVERMIEFEKKLYDMLIRLPNDYDEDYNADEGNDGHSDSHEGSDQDSDDSEGSNESGNDSDNSVDNDSDDEDSEDESDSSVGNGSDDEDSEDESDSSVGNDSNDEDSEDESDNSVGNESDNEDSEDESDNSFGNDRDDEDSQDESDTSVGNDSDDEDSEDFLRMIRRHTKKVMKKHAKKLLGRHILSEYSDEDEDDELDLEKEEFWAMTLWGDSLKAMLKEANIKRNKININDLITSSDLHKIYTLIEKTPKRVVVNYVHWKFINGILRHTTEKMRKMYFNVAGKKLGRTEPVPRWLWCIQQIGMKNIISYEYVKEYFPNDIKEMANSMIKKIRKVIEEEIEKSPWMSNKLKETSKEKLRFTKAEIGYPDWYDNSTAIEHYYKGLVINRDYFDNMLNFKKYDYVKKLRLMSEEFDMSEWAMMSPLTMNAMYVPWKNSLVVTAADFHRPFFDKSQPAAVNFGIIGFTIGHEFSHGFDPLGRNFDKNGDWLLWDIEDSRSYNKRMNCYVKMYNNYTIELKEENKTIKVNGKDTVGDNIADCMGLDAVHEAYRLWRKEQKDKKDLKLPGLEKFNDDQLFFLANAVGWCDAATPQYTKYLAKNDEHSPSRVRILGPMSNNEHFSEAFNCPRGSPMNPKKKCHIWK